MLTDPTSEPSGATPYWRPRRRCQTKVGMHAQIKPVHNSSVGQKPPSAGPGSAGVLPSWMARVRKMAKAQTLHPLVRRQ